MALILCSKIILCICQRRHVGNCFYAKYFLIHHDGISQNLTTNWCIGATITQTSFIGFKYEAVKISVNTTKGLLLINIREKFSFFTKNWCVKNIIFYNHHSVFSNEKFMQRCLEDKYYLNFSAWPREENNTNMSSTYRI